MVTFFITHCFNPNPNPSPNPNPNPNSNPNPNPNPNPNLKGVVPTGSLKVGYANNRWSIGFRAPSLNATRNKMEAL